jgi:hypothetical protein
VEKLRTKGRKSSMHRILALASVSSNFGRKSIINANRSGGVKRVRAEVSERWKRREWERSVCRFKKKKRIRFLGVWDVEGFFVVNETEN